MKIHFYLSESHIEYPREDPVSFLLLRGSAVQMSWQVVPRNISSIIDAYYNLKTFVVGFLADVEPAYTTEWSLYIPWPISCRLFDDDGSSCSVMFLDPFNLPEVL